MKAIISTTHDDKYLFYLPITTWCWNKLGVDVICFMPHNYITFGADIDTSLLAVKKFDLVNHTMIKKCLSDHNMITLFKAPEHKQATYAQVSRLFAASLHLPQDEVLISSDIDMAVFQVPLSHSYYFTVMGVDLVPKEQYPICYISATKEQWNRYFNKNRPTQQCLDDLMGDIECESFRGNYWGLDQETAYKNINLKAPLVTLERANPGTQFATKRYDRDDAYILDRLDPDTIDFHMNRPGYEDVNFEIIMKVLQYHYPYDDLTWMRTYRDEYVKLL